MAPHVPSAPDVAAGKELPVFPWHPAVMPDSGAWALSLTRCAHACCLQGREASAAAGKDGIVKICHCWLMRRWGAQQRGGCRRVFEWQTILDGAFCKGVPSDLHAVPSVRCPFRPLSPAAAAGGWSARPAGGAPLPGRGGARRAPPRQLRTPRLGRGRSRRSTPGFWG